VTRERESSEKDAGAAPAPLTADELRLAFEAAPLAQFVLVDGVVVAANEAFHRALGQAAGFALGRRLEDVVPPEHGPVPTARPGGMRGYRTHLAGVPARIDLAAAPAPRADGTLLVSGVLGLVQDEPDRAADQALLTLSRELAQARAEDQITGALARAVELLFPGRSFCIRLLDPRTLALSTLYASGRLRPRARRRLALRRGAVEKAGLAPEALGDGVALVDADEPLFEGSDAAVAVPLAAAGQLFGVVNLEYARGGPGDPDGDLPVLLQLVNHAALGVRNLRSIEELTYLKTYLEDLIENANALICTVNRAREVIVWNAALVKLTGIPKEEALGTGILLRVPLEERGRIADALARSFAGETVDGFETRILRKDGGEARIAVNTAPIYGASGEVEGVIAIGQDLTLLRSLQVAAEHAERLAGIGRLVAGVVHELNNPLTAVTMYSDVLVEKLAARGHDPADVEKLRGIKEAGQRIQRLARDLVAYARPTGTRTEPVDLAQVLDEAARMAKPALKEPAAVLELELAAVPHVEGNRASLVQVVLALLTNAAQAVPQGGRIRLALSSTEDGVELAVADGGPGMPPEVAARAFEPFFTTRPGVGVGLGLPIVSGIVERHGGRIALDTAPGKGTTVTVTLPLRLPSGEARPKSRPPPGDAPTHPRPPGEERSRK
jgi:PAS domain S-box-containing protein